MIIIPPKSDAMNTSPFDRAHVTLSIVREGVANHYKRCRDYELPEELCQALALSYQELVFSSIKDKTLELWADP